MVYYEYFAMFSKTALRMHVPEGLKEVVCSPQLWSAERYDPKYKGISATLADIKKMFIWNFFDRLEIEGGKLNVDLSNFPRIEVENFDHYWEVVFFRGVTSVEMVLKSYEMYEKDETSD